MSEIMKLSTPLIVKCAGGAAAQTLALMDAIYATQDSDRGFVFDYYPFGTGTYWPLEIERALLPKEIGNTSKLSRGHNNSVEVLQIGKIVESHPINSNSLNMERIYSAVRAIKLDSLLLRLRGEKPLNSSQARLNKVGKSTRIISGGYLPVLDKRVFESLHERFVRGGYPSPFNLEEGLYSEHEIVIHYRIGDKRAKFSNPGVVGGDGILDPEVIQGLLRELNCTNTSILLLSDEPEVAKNLLLEVGLSVHIQKSRGSIWDDLRTMAGAKLFIGTWSQVSQLASICVASRGGSAYLPSSNRGENSLRWSIPNINVYNPKFLDSMHSIYYKN
jgi:hypothetical protein